ncbi:MAG: tRNA uridine-5-carboxymethylaminomethyl(34) synthesis GTPase MnmE [bacterium]
MSSASSATIAAIATPPGEGGIGIIRLSGPRALETTDKFIAKDKNSLQPRQAHLTSFVLPDENNPLDQGLVLYFPGPDSYTGEDVVELNCHGSPVLLDTLLSAILEEPEIRLAEPGEFTRRAFENNRLDLAQADAVGELISARSKSALKSAARQLEGELSRLVNDLRETLIYCQSRVEASLDFSDQDSVDPIPYNTLEDELTATATEIKKLIEEGRRGTLISSGVHTPIVGKPNAGKSSLFNRLVQTNRSIVTSQPGTTRDILKDQLNLQGIPFELHDTAGLTRTEQEIESIGIERTQNAIKNADLVILVFDQSTPLTGEDQRVTEMVKEKNYIAVLNKNDCESRVTPENIKRSLGINIEHQISARTGKGIKKLKNSMSQSVMSGTTTFENPLVTQQRHLQALKKSLEFIEQALQGIEERKDEVLLAEDLRQAAEEAGMITGAITTEDLLDEIFQNFCIGK